MKYKNSNPDFGDTTTVWESETIDEAINDLQAALNECGEEFADCVVTENDITIIEE